MHYSEQNNSQIFTESFSILNFRIYENLLLEYFGKYDVTEIDFKEFWVLIKCRGEKYFAKAVSKKHSEDDILYLGLSLEEAKNIAEENREVGYFFRIISTPCLTIKCRNFYIAFFDPTDYWNFSIEKMTLLADGKVLRENKTYFRVMTYLKNIPRIAKRQVNFKTCILISSDTSLNSCKAPTHSLVNKANSFHYISTASKSYLKWDYINYYGEYYENEEF